MSEYVMIPQRLAKRDNATVEAWLKRRGFDGLANVALDFDDGCGCGLGDLRPCGEIMPREACVAARVSDEDGVEWFTPIKKAEGR